MEIEDKSGRHGLPDGLESQVLRLDYPQLQALNQLIVSRMRLQQQVNSLRALSRFVVGDTVSFLDKQGQTLVGRITRLNQKSASVLTTEGAQWTVHPNYLSKVVEASGG
jgi:16S rRNA U1498 N3-methylase RsmE